jgi:hypothetical protein
MISVIELRWQGHISYHNSSQGIGALLPIAPDISANTKNVLAKHDQEKVHQVLT